MTSTKSFPSYTQVRKDLTTEATATSVEDNADWGGIENLDVPQTESQAEKDAAAAKKAAEEEAEKQAEVEAQATQEQANAGLRVKMCVWLGVSRGLDLAFLNAD